MYDLPSLTKVSFTAMAFWALGFVPASADMTAMRAAVQDSDGHAVLVILDPTFVTNLPDIAAQLSGVGDIRVGVGSFGGEGPEATAAKENAIRLFTEAGFKVCLGWGQDTYDTAPEDLRQTFFRRFGAVYNNAGEVSLLIDNGDITQAGLEYGQEFLIEGSGTGEDRLFVNLETTPTEIRDDQIFSSVDLLIDSESIGAGTWDCMKGRT